MVEVFQTNVNEADEAGKVIALLQCHFPECKINIDLEDCDKVLRLEGNHIAPDAVITLVEASGYRCEELV